MNLKIFKTRPLNVSLSTANPTKRQATILVSSNSRSSNSPSPDPARADGGGDNAPSPTASTTEGSRPWTTDIQSRTVALLNVPDTVNDSRIRALAEPYGALVKVVLRPDHQGAILEYQDIASAGKAALGLEGHEIVPGRKLGVGDVREMRRQKAEFKNDRIGTGRSKKFEEGSKALQGAAPIRRPAQPSSRRGGKGGLGMLKRGPGLGVSPSGEGVQVADANANESDQRPKSNADFKAMLLNG
jgi:squamous cell carcinoma antigen recognized by T-cells 3